MSKHELLTRAQRDVMVAHMLEGHQVIVHKRLSGPAASEARARRHTTASLIGRGYLKVKDGGRCTVMTDSGRAALAKLLGEYADMLERARDAGIYLVPLRSPAPTPEEAPENAGAFPVLPWPPHVLVE